MCLALPALGEEEQADLVDGAAPTDASERFPASRAQPGAGRVVAPSQVRAVGTGESLALEIGASETTPVCCFFP